jgi:hypothetical protein
MLRQYKSFGLLEILILPILKPLKHDSRLLLCLEVQPWSSVVTVDELETLMWESGKVVDGANEIIFETRVNGKPVLANGRALIVTSGQKSKL